MARVGGSKREADAYLTAKRVAASSEVPSAVPMGVLTETDPVGVSRGQSIFASLGDSLHNSLFQRYGGKLMGTG